MTGIGVIEERGQSIAYLLVYLGEWFEVFTIGTQFNESIHEFIALRQNIVQPRCQHYRN